VLVTERRRERAGAVEGTSPGSARLPALRTGAAEDPPGRAAGRCRRQAAGATVGWHAQARRAGTGTGTGPAAAVPGRADRGPGSDRRGRIRPPDPHPAT